VSRIGRDGDRQGEPLGVGVSRLPRRIGEILYAGVPHSRKRGHARCGRGSGMNMSCVLLIHSHCQPFDART
jgi:hypothetical protein